MKIQFERFETWVRPFLATGVEKMIGTFDNLKDAQAAGDQTVAVHSGAYDFRDVTVTVNHIALTDEGRDEHSWVKSHDGGHWIALDLKTASYSH